MLGNRVSGKDLKNFFKVSSDVNKQCMKSINDYIAKIGGFDKFIHRESGALIVANAAIVGLLVAAKFSIENVLAFVMITLLFVILAEIFVALVQVWKEKKDAKEKGNSYDKKDIEAGVIGGIYQMVGVIIVLIVYVLL